MVEIQVKDGELIVEVKGFHRLLALKRSVRFPVKSLRAVRHDPSAAAGFWKGLRLPGTHLPGVIIAGTFYKGGQRHFYDVRRKERTIVLELVDAPYDRVIVEVEDPDREVSKLREASAR